MPREPQKDSLLNPLQRTNLESSAQMYSCLVQRSRDLTVSNKLPVSFSVFCSTFNPYSVVTLAINCLTLGFFPMVIGLLLCPPQWAQVCFLWFAITEDGSVAFQLPKHGIFSSILCSYVFMYFNTLPSSLWDLGRKQWYMYVFKSPSLIGHLQNFRFTGSLKYT